MQRYDRSARIGETLSIAREFTCNYDETRFGAAGRKFNELGRNWFERDIVDRAQPKKTPSLARRKSFVAAIGQKRTRKDHHLNTDRVPDQNFKRDFCLKYA